MIMKKWVGKKMKNTLLNYLPDRAKWVNTWRTYTYFNNISKIAKSRICERSNLNKALTFEGEGVC